MKFSVGYNMPAGGHFLDCIIKNREYIDEVYFSWFDFKNGRNSQLNQQGITPWEAAERQRGDLMRLHKNGIRFNLLFNGNCYGRDSLSRAFYNKIGDTVDFIAGNMNLSSVTAASPLIAKFIKTNFPEIPVRASVNMEIGTIQGMDYLAEFFDGYYMKRELNRNFPEIERLKNWCDKNGKTLCMLANSGCLNNCSAHAFHDNIVSHEAEIAEMDNCYEFSGICHEYLKNPEKRISLIRDTNFVRPEDIGAYEKYFSSVKLATRVSDKAAMILESYINGRYCGNVLELLEPNHAGRIFPYVIDNQRLSNDYFSCSHDCSTCGKCNKNFNAAVIKLKEAYQ